MNGKTLQILRYRSDLSIKEMSEKLGISESLLTKIEAGISPISTRVKTRILTACEVDEGLFEIVNKMRLFDGELN
ncbi:helix-turn-helix domain-containing protein [Bacillus sp. ISL-40]|uniref:helix-turn-helix domain-containing protein n=1 Tax=unclassified Bacillus (in: firmicutes) TaxID=185979 RepID=UPI001BE5ADF5|nr:MULTISPECIES: helix-turn-helix transcriptional regulator [unclassified Bacillus (in: firmicutes)]MBT2700653.1 helix-turn-helix domain-containing protein [Bacillus sp. ISL-40]MBT2743354.1 helix-turn-helix domain-containing protein [Bacillus sp. ISL-77]